MGLCESYFLLFGVEEVSFSSPLKPQIITGDKFYQMFCHVITWISLFPASTFSVLAAYC